MNQFKYHRYLRALDNVYVVIGLVTLIRIIYLGFSDLNLFFDEAQYWYWAKNPDFGYYSKPPLVAWIIAITTFIGGDSEFFVRISSPLFHAGSSLVIFATAHRLFNKEIGYWSAVTYLLLPAVSFSSFFMSTDPILIFFWSLSMYLFVIAVDKNEIKWWIFAGIAAGCGMMSKYNMLMFLPSALLYLHFSDKHKGLIRNLNFWSAIGIALLIFTPNIIWNLMNGLASFLHTRDNANLSKDLVHFNHLFEFFFAQFAVFGPILFGLFIYIFWNYKEYIRTDQKKLLAFFIAPLFSLILLVSFLSRAHANWAAPIYAPATILVVSWVFLNNKFRLLEASTILHVCVAVLVLNFNVILDLPFWKFTDEKADLYSLKIKDPLKRVHGWKELGQSVGMLHQEYPDTFILSDSRKIIAELMFYCPDPSKIIKWNPSGEIKDHFDLVTDINKSNSNNFLFVTDSDDAGSIKDYFSQVERVGNVEIRPHGDDYTIDFYIYHLTGFKGYGQ